MNRLRRTLVSAAVVVSFMAGLAPGGRAERAGGDLAPYKEIRPYSQREEEILQDLRSDEDLFRRGAEIFKSSVHHLIERAYLNEKALLERRYRTTLQEASRTAQSRRLEAIKEYEAFIKRYPDDRVWTPDVLLRLAELYFEKSEVDFRYADRRYQRRLREIERISRLAKRDLPVPPRPMKDYSASLGYYREILRRFPKYKNRDMVIYVLGYVLRLAAQEVDASDVREHRDRARSLHAQARQAFLGLVCANRFDPLQKHMPPEGPPGYSVSLTRPAMPPGDTNPFDGFDPYGDCRPAVDLSKLSGKRLEERRSLLGQTWFLIGEEHFDADPAVEIDPEERAKINKEYQAYRGPAREEVFQIRWNEMINEKKMRVLRLHNYFAISSYTRVARRFKDSKEYTSALYKRAWTYFKIDRYMKALQQFDELLVRAKEKDLQENAVRYVALCAFYQKQNPDAFGWLKSYYDKKGWLDGAGTDKYPHVKASLHQLGEILWEEAQPPPDDPGAQNYDGEMLQRALAIFRWILEKGGFKEGGGAAADNRDWRYYRGKAPIQVRVLQILGILHVNVDKRVRAKFPRSRLYEERKRAFDRFTLYRENPYLAFAREYDRRWKSDKEVAEALMVLRENSLMAMGRDFFNLGGQYLTAYQKTQSEYEQLSQERKVLEERVEKRVRGWRKARAKLRKILPRLAELEEKRKSYRSSYQGYFVQAARAFQVIIEHPQHKNTLTSYKALFYMGQALYFSGKYLEASRVFKAVQNSKISVRKAKEALNWRLSSFGEVVSKIKLPPDPDPDKDKNVKPREVPPLLEEYHALLGEVMAQNPKSKDVPVYKYLIAANYFRYHQFDKAKPLFEELLTKYCDTVQGFYAGRHLLTMLSIRKGPEYLDRLEVLARRLKEKNCGGKVTCKADDPSCQQFRQDKKESDAEIAKLGPMILRERAFKAFGNKEYEKAARYFAEIVKRYPDSKDIALFLYNAAYSYEKINRFNSAKGMYELIYTKYRKQAAETKIKDESGKVLDDSILDNVLEYLAGVAIKALDYDSALKYYGILATDKSFASHDGRVAWYFVYAKLLKYHGEYDKAVHYFRDKYVGEVKGQLSRWRRLASRADDPEKKKRYEGFIKDAKKFVPRADLEIGQIRERQGKKREMTRFYLSYVNEIERELRAKRSEINGPEYWPKHLDDWVKAREMMGLLQKILKTYREIRAGRRAAKEIEDRILDDFKDLKLPPRTRAASYAAAIAFDRIQSNLEQAKKDLKYEYPRIRVRWRWNKVNALKNRSDVIQKGRNAVAEALKKLSDRVDRYTKIYLEQRDRFPDNEWYVAFQAHIGKIYELAAAQVADPKFPDLVQRWFDLFKKELDDPYEFEEKIKGYVFGNPSKPMEASTTWEDLAKKFYRAALDHAQKAGVATEWTRTVRRWLSRIDPSRPFVNDAKIEPIR